ncbi:MAG: hypothetical protein FJ284_09525, partial [Planctomycetes bacterium]|nr:hypothetical protein [Planctomycetota bacterium]
MPPADHTEVFHHVRLVACGRKSLGDHERLVYVRRGREHRPEDTGRLGRLGSFRGGNPLGHRIRAELGVVQPAREQLHGGAGAGPLDGRQGDSAGLSVCLWVGRKREQFFNRQLLGVRPGELVERRAEPVGRDRVVGRPCMED